MAQKPQKIAVLGAGPGGVAAAASLALRGLDVSLYNRTAERVASLQRAGGVHLDGALGDGFVPLPLISTDPDEALRGRDAFVVTTPAYGQAFMVESLAPYLKPGALVLLCSGSAGALCAAKCLRNRSVDIERDVLLAEPLTVPQSARFLDEQTVPIKIPAPLRAAAFPAVNTPRLLEALDGLFNLVAAAHVLDTGLNNPNFIIHPAPMLLNYAEIERRDQALSIMNEGMTPAVLRCMDALDAEKRALLAAVCVEPVTVDDLYREIGSDPSVYREPGEPMGLKDRIWRRYVEEDVPYGTVMMASLGRLLGVATPVCDGVNTLLSAAEARDYWAEGRTVERLGIAGMDHARLMRYLETGKP